MGHRLPWALCQWSYSVKIPAQCPDQVKNTFIIHQLSQHSMLPSHNSTAYKCSFIKIYKFKMCTCVRVCVCVCVRVCVWERERERERGRQTDRDQTKITCFKKQQWITEVNAQTYHNNHFLGANTAQHYKFNPLTTTSGDPPACLSRWMKISFRLMRDVNPHVCLGLERQIIFCIFFSSPHFTIHFIILMTPD